MVYWILMSITWILSAIGWGRILFLKEPQEYNKCKKQKIVTLIIFGVAIVLCAIVIIFF